MLPIVILFAWVLSALRTILLILLCFVLFLIIAECLLLSALNVCNEIINGNGLEVMLLCKLEAVIAARHEAILVPHNLADDGCGLEAAELRQVDAGLGVAPAGEHAAVDGSERQNVAGLEEGLAGGGGVGELAGGQGAVVGRDAGGGAVREVDGDGVGGAVPVRALGAHEGKVESVGNGVGDGRAHVARRVAHQERHLLGRDLLGRDDEIAFILARLVVENNQKFTVLCVGGKEKKER